VNIGRKLINKCKDLENKRNFLTSKLITDMMIKKKGRTPGIEPRLPEW
jgi:hypothetical protein